MALSDSAPLSRSFLMMGAMSTSLRTRQRVYGPVCLPPFRDLRL
jgi:hypothetical protein